MPELQVLIQILPPVMSSHINCAQSAGRSTACPLPQSPYLSHRNCNLVLKTGDVEERPTPDLPIAGGDKGRLQPGTQSLSPTSIPLVSPVRLRRRLKNRMLLQLLHTAMSLGSPGPLCSTLAAPSFFPAAWSLKFRPCWKG